MLPIHGRCHKESIRGQRVTVDKHRRASASRVAAAGVSASVEDINIETGVPKV
jgi:hypothetical protein